MLGDTHITDSFEGILYPTPEIIPDEENTKKSEDSGVVSFDFTHRPDLVNYVDTDGSVLLQTSLGINEEVLIACARKYVALTYESADIILGRPKFTSKNQHPRILVRYTVNL